MKKPAFEPFKFGQSKPPRRSYFPAVFVKPSTTTTKSSPASAMKLARLSAHLPEEKTGAKK